LVGKDLIGKEGTLWLLEYRFMMDLEWDLGEWFWGGLGTKILVPLYQYISRIKYRSIIRHEGTKLVITTTINEEIMKIKQIIGALNQLWHHSKPRKVTMLIWLALSHGVLAGA
jgi:hypothetical protein